MDVAPDKTGNVRINVTLRRVRLIIVAVEKLYVLNIMTVSVALVITKCDY
jgi:hypothetical protein